MRIVTLLDGHVVVRSVRGEAESRCIGIGLRAAVSAKGNSWLDSALDNRRIEGLTPVSILLLGFVYLALSVSLMVKGFEERETQRRTILTNKRR